MRVLSSVPIGIYAIYTNEGTPLSLRFIYARGDLDTVSSVLNLSSDSSCFVAPFALDLRRVFECIAFENLISLRVNLENEWHLGQILEQLHLGFNDIANIPKRLIPSGLGKIPQKVRLMTGSFSMFADVVAWFNYKRAVFAPVKLTNTCVIDTAPLQFKTIFVDGVPMCYWNTSVPINEELKKHIETKPTGLIINTLKTKQVLTMEMTRHKFVEVGEKLVIDFQSGACIRTVGLVNSAKTVHTKYQSVFDTSRNIWYPYQETMETTKILGMRSE